MLQRQFLLLDLSQCSCNGECVYALRYRDMIYKLGTLTALAQPVYFEPVRSHQAGA